MATQKKATTSRTSRTSSTRKKAPSKQTSAPRTQAPRRPSAGKVAEIAAGQLLDLTGKDAEGVTGLERTEDGWKVMVDVVELRRVPSTTDVLATYEVEVDPRGDLQGYRRVRRFPRGSAGEE